MADERVVSEIVTKFFLNTCRLRPQPSRHAFDAAYWCAKTAAEHPVDDAKAGKIPLITGSVAEFYIEPMLPHVGDIDVMYHRSTLLAIPRGHPPPTQLPDEFHNYVKVCEIVDSHLPGYVYLQVRYLLAECTEDDKYNYFEYDRKNRVGGNERREKFHGPALLADNSHRSIREVTIGLHVEKVQCVRRSTDLDHSSSFLPVDIVPCIRCLSWPSQASDWPTRHRNYDWPDSATVCRVVSNGCDVVQVAHRQCRQDKRMSMYQWRLSFSRAEIVLINSWMPVQQIVYHMLRVFAKTERLKDTDAKGALSNYHIKTLMMWACERESNGFWTSKLNLTRICVELLHTFSVWLTDARCPHYFTNSCNLIDNFLGVETIASQLMSINDAWLSTWFVNNYIRKCSMLCPDNVSSLLTDVSTNTKLQNAVSAAVNWRLNTALKDTWCVLQSAEFSIPRMVLWFPRSCVCWMTKLTKTDTHLPCYFTAVTFLHVAYKISTIGFTDELMDVLTSVTGQFISKRRRCYPSQCSSELSLSETTKLKVVANSSGNTMQLIDVQRSSATYLNTSELVGLLQRYAVEHLTTCRQLEARDFGSVATIVTTDFEALYAYKRGDYQRCLQLSTENVHALLYAVVMPMVLIFPDFIQLLDDDDIVSLAALSLIVDPKRSSSGNECVSQLTLLLYLMTQCQLKLRHSVASLAQTLHYIKVAQRKHARDRTLDHLTLKLMKRKVLMYYDAVTFISYFM